MNCKLLELRDRATFIPAIAISMVSVHPREHYLLRRAGYGPGNNLVLLTRLEGGESHYDPYDWRLEPWRTAHFWLEEHWDEVETGAVIDAEFLRGESAKPKESEASAHQ